MPFAFTDLHSFRRGELAPDQAAAEAGHLIANPVLFNRLPSGHQPSRRRAEQAKSEDRAAMGIHPAGSLQHIRLARHAHRTQHRQYLFRRDIGRVVAHNEKLLHPWRDSRRAGLKRGQIHIPMRAGVTNIHQARFRRQADFGQQRSFHARNHLLRRHRLTAQRATLAYHHFAHAFLLSAFNRRF